jgi:hypothetical protein
MCTYMYLGERFSNYVTKHGSLFAWSPRLDSGRDFNFRQSLNTTKIELNKRNIPQFIIIILFKVLFIIEHTMDSQHVRLSNLGIS